MTSALDRKLLREVWRLRGQMASIALVVACGIMTVVTMRGTYESLAWSLERYYREYRFADVFASLERAPEPLAQEIARIPGVVAVQTRVVLAATLDVPGLAEPAVGRMLSVPANGPAALNDIHVVRGRTLDPRRPDEVLVSESFARANGLEPGDSLGAVINGRWRRLEVVGIAISPDYVGEVAPGAVFPDDRRFGVLRMSRSALGPATGMEGAFNEVSLRLAPGARESEVIERLDRILEPYGGLGAYGRARHPSHEAVMSELEQNRISGTVIPAIFLGVAAFLLSVVLGRMVATQRVEIGVLKAFGYSNSQVGRHFLRFALVPVVAGAVLGTGLGIWFGKGLTGLYGEFFRFPDLAYRVSWRLVAVAVGVSVAAAGVGAMAAVRSAVRLPPAEAMRPPAPARFRPGPVERLGLGRWLSASGQMIVRNVERQPFRSLASALGVAFSTALVLSGLFFVDSARYMADVQFDTVQREDLAVTFTALRPRSIRYDLAELDGVTRVEVARTVPVRIGHAHHQRTTTLTGIDPDAKLRRVVDRDAGALRVPPRGMVLNSTLAEVLGVAVGDTVTVKALHGRRREIQLPVAATVGEMFGMAAYTDREALSELLGADRSVSEAYLSVRADRVEGLNERLKRLPAVASVYSPAALRATFEQQLSENLLISVTFLVSLACVLAVGVIYNGARVALSERGRELASLRVLGFTRREVGALLLGEQAALTLLAVPAGLGIGVGVVAYLLAALASERYRFPFLITGRTYLLSASVTVLAATFAALAVRRRLDRLDLVAVLKTRE